MIDAVKARPREAVSMPEYAPTSRLATMSVREIRSEARHVAAQVLEDHWPEGTFPVDPVVIALRMGVEVFNAQLGNDVFGMLVGAPTGARIYLDEDQPPKRYRFTAAHELGHYVDRTHEVDPGASYIDRRSEEGRGTAQEIFANEFAGCLLMPEAALGQYLQDHPDDLFGAANAFGVSFDAAEYRKRVLEP